jgi:GNAT superfamily N-acetyltransferase
VFNKIPMPIIVRSVEQGDIAALAAIRASESQTAAFWEARISRYLTGEHSPQQALQTRALFVAVDGGAVAGFVAGHLTRRYECDGELQWIDVAGERRRKGTAARLMMTIAAWFAQQNAPRVCVNVAAENEPARALYAKYGGKPLNDHWMIWEDIRTISGHSG